MLTGCRLGERRIQELFLRFGAATVRETWALFQEQCRETIQKTLRARLPDGTWESDDAVDGDGMSGRPFHVRMSLTKRGDRISIDTRASDDQAQGPINFIMHDPVSGEFFLCSDGIAVGYRARPFADGLDAIYYVAQKNYPAEFLEMVFPMRLRQYALHRDSGGPGLWRGGCGVVREVELLADEAVVALRQDNVLFPSAGVNGGHVGRPGRAVLNPGRTDERQLAAMSDGNVMRRGDVLRLYTRGGGGWGNPLARPLARVRRDVIGGFVSPESARGLRSDDRR